MLWPTACVIWNETGGGKCQGMKYTESIQYVASMASKRRKGRERRRLQKQENKRIGRKIIIADSLCSRDRARGRKYRGVNMNILFELSLATYGAGHVTVQMSCRRRSTVSSAFLREIIGLLGNINYTLYTQCIWKVDLQSRIVLPESFVFS